jgi:23S rRNA (adenine1618-N6)-methyltransferase
VQGRSATSPKPGLHPRNPHRDRYDFARLIKACPELAPFVALNAYQNTSIDFADPQAVRTLNKALLMDCYGLSTWDVPAGFLCPPIPGRADYIHHAADLLGSCNGGSVPRGTAIRVLDIGTGASCIYPILGHCAYGWSFVGADIDPAALASAQRIVQANGRLENAIELRLQPDPSMVFSGLLNPEEVFDLAICNPPFHASLAEAREGARLKWRNLGKGQVASKAPLLNFGGQASELWCEGGEEGFAGRMIEESTRIPTRCFWFTTLIAKATHLPVLYRALRRSGAVQMRTLGMAQGQKKSRLVAWSFLTPAQQQAWRAARWGALG